MVVQDYDKELIIPLSMKVSQILTPHCNHTLAKIEQVSNGFIFGIEASNEEVTHALLVKGFDCLKELLLALMKLQNLWSHGKRMKFNL
jgi:hypothetical protein